MSDTLLKTDLESRAQRWLQDSDERLVASSLFYLNRMAKEFTNRYERDELYTLKNRVVKALFAAGFCTDVGIHTKQLECFNCEGTGEDVWADREEGASPEPCWKCGGTGIYRTLVYYIFHFDIHGQHFAFHQPDWAVTWPVETVAHQRNFDDREPSPVNLRWERLPLYMAIVKAYLANQGVEQ